MPEFELPLSTERVRFSLPAATSVRIHPTPFADLPATQAAIAAYLPATLAKIRARLAERLPPVEGKNSAPFRYQRVLLLLPDDARRVGFDPWLGELADGIVQSADGDLPVQGFTLGQSDDPPLGMRLIRHAGEDFCGRFALESHYADREDDHDPEQEGLDTTVLQSKTLLVAVRPVFEATQPTNDLAVFLGRGLLARPLVEILEAAALDAVRHAAPKAEGVEFDRLVQAELVRAFTPVVADLLHHVVDAPFCVDSRGEPVVGHVPKTPNSAPETFDTVVVATGAAPTDLWFANLVSAAVDGCTYLKAGGRLIVLGSCDEGLPLPDLRPAIAELQSSSRKDARSIARGRAASGAVAAALEPGDIADADEPSDDATAPALQRMLLGLGEVLSRADQLIFASPGLVPEEDDDESERERRELPAGKRVIAVASLDAALAQATGSVGVIEV